MVFAEQLNRQVRGRRAVRSELGDTLLASGHLARRYLEDFFCGFETPCVGFLSAASFASRSDFSRALFASATRPAAACRYNAVFARDMPVLPSSALTTHATITVTWLRF
jgi:hypothetical protein